MSNITSVKVAGNTLTIGLEGRISSANAPEVESAMAEAIAANPCENLAVDMDALEYISSAGLRVLLRLRKQFPELTLCNVSAEIYEILEMTGFTEMMKVVKAYRRVSVEGCEIIGEGANGTVYRLDADTIVKVYKNPDALPEIKRERDLAKRAFVLGIPTAIPYDVARVGDKFGSVFEMLNAKTFAQLIAAEPENLDKYIAMSVELLKLIHGTVAKPGDMPDMKAVALDWAKFLVPYLPEEISSKLISLVEAVPEQYTVMHGDYHMKNVMLQNGEMLLIDMDTLALGHPVFEFASVFQAYIGFAEVQHLVGFMDFLGLSIDVCNRIWERTVPLYLGTEDAEKVQAVREKAMVIGYARIMRRTIRRKGLETPEGREQIEICRRHLIELVPKVDSLVF